VISARIAFIEQRQLEGASIEQGADLRRSQRGDPIQSGGLQLSADAGTGDHATIADQHDPRQAKAPFELVDLPRQRHRVGGIAFKDLNRHRTAIGGTQQAIDDLQFALLAVSRIAEACQLAALTLKPGRREVVEHQRPVREVAAGERSLDRALACAEPVEGAVELDLVDRAKPEEPAQARGGGVGGQLARGGELGGG
jgi:hypothetical protein